MTAGEVIALFRSESVEANHYFAVDTELCRYLNEGYVEFCRQTSGTPDEVELDHGVGEYEIDVPVYVMRVKSARRLTDNRPVEIINYTDLKKRGRSDYSSIATLYADRTTPGGVRFMVLGEKKHTARLISVPDTSDTLMLLVDRMPINTISGESSQFTDIDAVYQPAMLDWLKSRVFRRPADGLFNPKLAEFFEGRFNGIVSEARAGQELFKAKVRTVQYGGI